MKASVRGGSVGGGKNRKWWLEGERGAIGSKVDTTSCVKEPKSFSALPLIV